MSMLFCGRCGTEGPNCLCPEPGEGVLYRHYEDEMEKTDKPAPCGRTFDLTYRSSMDEGTFSVDTMSVVRITATGAREALTFVESDKFLSEKLKGMYLVSIT